MRPSHVQKSCCRPRSFGSSVRDWLKFRAWVERQSHSYVLAQANHVKRRDGAFSSAKCVRDIHGKKGNPFQVECCGSGPCRTCCSRDRKAEGINADGPPTAPWGCGSQAAPNLPSFNFGSCARTKVNTAWFFRFTSDLRTQTCGGAKPPTDCGSRIAK